MPVLQQNSTGNTLADVTSLVRSLLNDVIARTWKDQVLTPYANSAYRQTQRELAIRGIKTQVTTVIITMPIGGKNIMDLPAAPDQALPGDFIQPWTLEERGNGTTEKFTEMAMATDGLPDTDPGPDLCRWLFENNYIQTIGATRIVDIRLKYQRSLPTLAGAFDGNGAFNGNATPLGIRDAVDMIAFKTAALCARSRGVVNLAKEMDDNWKNEVTNWVMTYWKPKQRTPVRARPYGSRLRSLR